ncbi:MAG: glycosyltransferase family 10 [Leptolyngbyaceae cyanobacterium bins.59]|nr:glycosyltransferase family 10 [Leptolyngbyaceae cyanobacterium bins.59]
MAKTIVGMLTSYSGITQRDWLWQQTPHAFGVWGNIQMQAFHPEPEYLLLYQYDFPKPTVQKSWFGKKQIEPPNVQHLMRGVPKERIIFLLREPPLEEVIDQNRANYAEALKYCGYISGPDHDAPTPAYMPAIWYHSNPFRELNDLGIPEKSRTCSWITSGISRTANHRRRLAFLRSLQESNIDIDFYGRGLPDWVKSGGELQNKWYAMAPYTYNLAIENYAENDLYVSEKLWDSLLAWCLPIYYGGSAADKLLPPGSFLRLPSLDEKGIAYIRDVTSTPDAWHEAKEAIAEARQIILHKLNLLNWLSEFVERVY